MYFCLFVVFIILEVVINEYISKYFVKIFSMFQKEKYSKSDYFLIFNFIGWILFYIVSVREMYFVFVIFTVGMKLVNLCFLELCFFVYIDTFIVLRNRVGGYVFNIDFIFFYCYLVFNQFVICCFDFVILGRFSISGREGYCIISNFFIQ